MTSKIEYHGLAIGVEMSQRQPPGAICVTDIQQRDGWGAHQRHWVVRHLERIPAGTRLPKLTERLKEVIEGASRRSRRSPQVLINATGFGKPLVDQFESQFTLLFYTVYFNQGDRRIEGEDWLDHIVNLGKAYLVSSVQIALQSERLHLPRGEEFDLLAEELLGYQVNLAPDANERYGSFRVGTRDELVNALGLTVQHVPGLTTAIGGAGDDDDPF